MRVFKLLERRAQPVDREIAQAGALAKSLDTGKWCPISSWPRLTLRALAQRSAKVHV
jgi:hypothetical protein